MQEEGIKKVKDGRKKEYKKRKKDRKEEGIWGERMKEKKSLLALNWSGLFCWSSCLWNRRGWLEGLFSLFSLPEPHSLLLFSLQSSSSVSFCSPLGL